MDSTKYAYEHAVRKAICGTILAPIALYVGGSNLIATAIAGILGILWSIFCIYQYCCNSIES